MKFFGFSGSHSCEAVYAAARYKGIEFEKVEVPPALHRIMMRTMFGNAATDEQVQKDLNHLPVLLDRVDELIEQGVIGAEEPNAADFQLLSSVGMCSNMQALRPAIIDRPCGIAAMRLFPRCTGAVPSGLLPDEWFAGLRPAVSSAA
ncbi:MAG: glutathione S-transferase N-terminal domain-containing protein [Solirubrobacterales bacterium]